MSPTELRLVNLSQASGKSSVVAEVAAMTGQPFFSLHCTPHTSSCTLINCLQGTALTGEMHYSIHIHSNSAIFIQMLERRKGVCKRIVMTPTCSLYSIDIGLCV